MALGPIESLVHSTVRIETTLKDGRTSCGTGFFMNFLQKEDQAVPAIITNKHVVAGADNGKFHLTLAKTDGSPNVGSHREFSFPDFESRWLNHPDPNIDLAAFLVGPIVHEARQSGVNPFFVPLMTDLIPLSKDRAALSPMEDVVMIGYPSGIWDAVNNLPIIRRGITATHSAVAWNGKSEFLTDIASFPGSSGSPVLLANIGGFTDSLGNTFMGQSRIWLLGIHYAGAMHTATGEIKIVTAPTANMPISVTSIPNNIGVAINSEKLLDFEGIIEKLINSAV